SFVRLQQRTGIRDPDRAGQGPRTVYYYLLNLLEHDGEAIRPLPLPERKARLRAAVTFQCTLRYTTSRRGIGEPAVRYACPRACGPLAAGDPPRGGALGGARAGGPDRIRRVAPRRQAPPAPLPGAARR